MDSRDSRIVRYLVDGATLLAPDDDAWVELEREGSLDGRRLGTGNILAQHRALAAQVEGLVVALAEEREPGKPFIVLHLVAHEGRLVRIVVESTSCLACGEGALVGVTRRYDLYMGTRDPLAAMRANAEHPLAACLRCGGALDRPALLVLKRRAGP